jgi:hypothetical protein
VAGTPPVNLTIPLIEALKVSTTTMSSAQVSAAYNTSFASSGGTPPYTWSIPAGALPDGLTFNASTGAVTGTPTTAGTYNFSVRVIDANFVIATKNLSIVVKPALAIETTTMTGGQALAAYSQTLEASGGTSPYTWSLTAGSSLPSGLTLATTGIITGTPVAAGTFSFTVKVTDAYPATTTRTLSLTILPALNIATTSIAAGSVGNAYSETIVAEDGTVPYTAWAITTGSLPDGLTLTGATISGTPTIAGSYPITVQVSDSYPATDTQTLTIVIGP